MASTETTRSRPDDADRYGVLLEIGRTLAATLGEDELYEAIYRETARAIEAAGFYITLYDQSRDLARVVFYADKGDVRRVDVVYRGSDSQVIRSREALLEKGHLEEGSLMVLGDESSEPTAASVTAPMIHHGRVLGAISAQSYDPDAYDLEDLALLQGIADIAAVAVENALQFAELERRRREAEKIEEIGRALTSELDPELVLGKVVGAVLDVLDVDGAAVWLTEGPGSHLCHVAEAGGDIMLPIGLEWNIEGALAQALDDDRAPVVIDDLAESDLVPDHLREHLSAGSAVGVPIEVDGRLAGVLTAGSRMTRRFSAEDTAVLLRLARQGSIALQNARLHASLHALSITDPLTQLPNRRRLQIHLEHEVAAARRGRPLAIAVFDIDNFKHYNDTFGHVAGDEILKAFADVLAQENRAMNVVARFGGDEFVSALTDTTLEGVRAYVERIEKHIASDEVLSRFAISVSAGIAVFDLNEMATVNDLLRAADADMYERKAERRSRRGAAAH
ncbi:MAG TPA: diguanylate cyclase [Longimicrobiales bacterium]|nr:diguanylate cyclase [Longimicrobiales bacterium]